MVSEVPTFQNNQQVSFGCSLKSNYGILAKNFVTFHNNNFSITFIISDFFSTRYRWEGEMLNKKQCAKFYSNYKIAFSYTIWLVIGD